MCSISGDVGFSLKTHECLVILLFLSVYSKNFMCIDSFLFAFKVVTIITPILQLSKLRHSLLPRFKLREAGSGDCTLNLIDCC